MKRWIAVLVITAAAFAAVPAIASAADVYEGYSRVGSVNASYGGRYTIRQGYYQAGYTNPSYGGRWNVYQGYSRVGYVNGGTGGPAAAAGLLLLVG